METTPPLPPITEPMPPVTEPMPAIPVSRGEPLSGPAKFFHELRELRLAKLERRTEFYRSIGEVAIGKVEEVIEEVESVVPTAAAKPKSKEPKSKSGSDLTRMELEDLGIGRLSDAEKQAIKESILGTAELRDIKDEEARTRILEELNDELIDQGLEKLSDEEWALYRKWELEADIPNLTDDEVAELETMSDRRDDPYYTPPKHSTKLMDDYAKPSDSNERRHEKKVRKAVSKAVGLGPTVRNLRLVRPEIEKVDIKRGGERVFLTPSRRHKEIKRLKEDYKKGKIGRDHFEQELAHLKHVEFIRTGQPTKPSEFSVKTEAEFPGSISEVTRLAGRGIRAERKVEEVRRRNNEKYVEALRKRRAKITRKEERKRDREERSMVERSPIARTATRTVRGTRDFGRRGYDRLRNLRS